MNRSNKKLNHTLSYLKSIYKSRKGEIISGPLKGRKISIKRNKDIGFSIHIYNAKRIKEYFEDWFSIEILINKKKFFIDKAYLSNDHTEATPTSVKRVSSGDFIHLSSCELKEEDKFYQRLVFQTQKEIIPHLMIKNSSFIIDDSEVHRWLVEVINDKTGNVYHLYPLEKEGKTYFIIECNSSESIKNFDEFSWATIISYGFITGKLIQDEGTYFFYDSEEMQVPVAFLYHSFRESQNSIYKPIYANAFGYCRKDKGYAETIQPYLRELTSQEFSTLCNKINNNKDFAALTLLTIEASIGSLLVRPACYSVVLEGLTEIFYEKNKKRINPIPNSPLAKKILNDIKMTVISHKDDLEKLKEGSFLILEKNITKLNQPINKDKLKAPFKLLEIPITADDETAIAHRNDFLHGNINLSRKKHKEATLNIIEITNRMNTLINSIILKSIGFDGYIVNHVKVNEKGAKRKIDEGYFRSITLIKSNIN